ncbi:MAG TPA: DUF2490 domain-containing protein [Sphingomicrobium sp.]
MSSLTRAAGAAASLFGLALAAPAAAADDSQLWTNATAVVKLSDRWRLSEDLTFRFSDKRNGLYEIESNTLVGYRLSKVVTVWAGYTHDPQYSGGDFTIMERRAREQVSFDNFAPVGPGKLSGRLRLEQRWREGLDGTGWRVRPYLKYTLPIKKGARTGFVFSTEPFLNLNTTPFQRTDGLDRVRSLVAFTTPLNKKIAIEVGYLNQHTFVRHGPDADDHVASLSLSLSL